MKAKTFLLLMISIAGTNISLAQKPAIDTSVYDKWPSLDYWSLISNDGRFAAYVITNIPNGLGVANVRSRSKEYKKLVAQGIQTGWKMEIPDVVTGMFTRDSRKLVYTCSDSLFLLTLGTGVTEFVSQGREPKLVPVSNGELLVYWPTTPEKNLVMQHLGTGKKTVYSAVSNYSSPEDGKILVLEKEIGKNDTWLRGAIKMAGMKTTTLLLYWAKMRLLLNGLLKKWQREKVMCRTFGVW